MALFFFNLCDGETQTIDEDGLELTSSEDAYLEAVSAARGMWGELLASRINPLRCAFNVTNETGHTLFRVEFPELLEQCRPADPGSPPLAGVMQSLERVHERANAARAEIASSLAQVRRSLAESNDLISKLERLERRSSRAEPIPAKAGCCSGKRK